MFFGAILKPNEPYKLNPKSLESPVLHISNAAIVAKDDKVNFISKFSQVSQLIAKVNGK